VVALPREKVAGQRVMCTSVTMACILFTNEGGAGSMVLCPHIFSPAKLGGFALRNIRTTSGMTAKCFMFLLAFAVSLLVWNIGAQAAGPSFVYDSLG